jgi:hypothetical protein
MSLLSRFAAVCGLVAATVVSHVAFVRPWMTTWGASQEERARAWPGDDLLADAPHVTTRAITIHAATQEVWPWIAQIGQDRSGWYSYRLLENLAGCDMPRVHRLVPEFQARAAGDKVWMYPPGKAGGGGHALVARVDAGRALVMAMPAFGVPDASRFRQTTYSAILEPIDAGSTRLIMRSRSAAPSGWMQAGLALLLEPIVFVMERKMMITIGELAEGRDPPEFPDLVQAGLWLAFGILAAAALVRMMFARVWFEPFMVMVLTAAFLAIAMLRQPDPFFTAALYVAAGTTGLVIQRSRRQSSTSARH